MNLSDEEVIALAVSMGYLPQDCVAQVAGSDIVGRIVNVARLPPAREELLRELLTEAANHRTVVQAGADQELARAAQRRYAQPSEGPALLGRGSTAAVWRYRDGLLGKDVALKKMEVSPDVPLAVQEARFTREAIIAAALGDHPNILGAFDHGRLDGQLFMAMPLVEGKDLEERLQKATPEEALGFLPSLVRVAEALQYMHDRGVVHADVKPRNILLGSHGRVWLADLGVAQLMDTASPELTHEVDALNDAASPGGNVAVPFRGVGTPGFIAPEVESGGRLTQRVDCYAWGAVLRQVLARAGGVPAALQSVVDATQRQDPMLRPTAGELAQNLDAWLQKKDVPLHDYTWMELRTKRVRDNPGAWTLIGILLAGLALVTSALGLSSWWASETQEQAAATERRLRLLADDARDESRKANEGLKVEVDRESAEAHQLEAQDEALSSLNAYQQRLVHLMESQLFESMMATKGALPAEKAIKDIERLALDAGAQPTEEDVDSSSGNMAGFLAFQVGSNTLAEQEYAKCAGALGSKVEADSASADAIATWGRCVMGVGDALEAHGKMALAMDRMREADQREAKALERHADPRLSISDSLILSRLGAIELETGLINEAEDAFRQSKARVDPLRRSSDAYSREAAEHRTAVALLYLGYSALERGEFDSAGKSFQAALDIDEPRAKHDRSAARPDSDLVEDLVGLARVDIAQGHPDKARERLGRAEKLIDALMDVEPQRVEWKVYSVKVEDAWSLATPTGSYEMKLHAEKLQQRANEILAADQGDIRGLHARALAELRLGRDHARVGTLREMAQLSPEDLHAQVELLQWQVVTGARVGIVDNRAKELLPLIGKEAPLRETLIVTWVVARRYGTPSAGQGDAPAEASGENWTSAAVDLGPLEWKARTDQTLRQAMGDLVNDGDFAKVGSSQMQNHSQ